MAEKQKRFDVEQADLGATARPLRAASADVLLPHCGVERDQIQPQWCPINRSAGWYASDTHSIDPDLPRSYGLPWDFFI